MSFTSLLYIAAGFALLAVVVKSRRRRGGLQMSRPSLVVFTASGERRTPKLLVRSNLTGADEQGAVIRQMYAKMHSKAQSWKLDTWEIGNPGATTAGPGLFVSKDGHEASHHFTPSSQSEKEDLSYSPGYYFIELYGAQEGAPPRVLQRSALEITPEVADTLNNLKHVAAIYTWNAQLRKYEPKLAPATLDNMQVKI